MRKLIPITLAVAALAAAWATVSTTTTAAAAEGAEAARVVSVKHSSVPKRKVIRHTGFRPWSRPSKRQVHEIIRAEARRWRIDPAGSRDGSAVSRAFNWWAGNGSFRGLLQFHPGTFHRGLRTIRTRQVTLVRERVRRVHGARYVRYSDGTVKRRRGSLRRQRVVHVYQGRLSRRPGVTDAWTQLRIGAQAIRGISAVRSSEWSCGA